MLASAPHIIRIMGHPHFSYDEVNENVAFVWTHGISQFLKMWTVAQKREGDDLLWGDEIESMIVSFDHNAQNARLSLRQDAVLKNLRDNLGLLSSDRPFTFQYEGARYMVESTPGRPYSSNLNELLRVETNMLERRAFVRRHLKPNETLMTLTAFPRLGASGKFTDTATDFKYDHGLCLPNSIISASARYQTYDKMLRDRRNGKPIINLPIFLDENTPRPFEDPMLPRDLYAQSAEPQKEGPKKDHIFLDAMSYGSGCCCLQVTLQAPNMASARWLYDAFVPIGPIVMALSASSPVWRGYLSDVDCRWDVLCTSTDDRTPEERGITPLSGDSYRIPKSRYNSVSLYVAEDHRMKPEYNDIAAPYNVKSYNRLRDQGVDERLARHTAYLFIREPIIVDRDIRQHDTESNSDHYESIQGSNWQSMRLKLPSKENPHLGWRVEFRTMEVQWTDFENAAFAIFIVLLSRAILKFDLNFYVPISKVDDNMSRAQRRDAVRRETFWFRKDVFSRSTPAEVGNGTHCPDLNGHQNGVANGHLHGNSKGGLNGAINGVSNGHANGNAIRGLNGKHVTSKKMNGANSSRSGPVEDEYEEMTIDEIMNGKSRTFPGLIGLVEMYLDTERLDTSVEERLRKYLELLRGRANGTLATPASWMRTFIRSHPRYGFDSVVTQEINYDLLVAIDEIERGIRLAPDLLPSDWRDGAR